MPVGAAPRSTARRSSPTRAAARHDIVRPMSAALAADGSTPDTVVFDPAGTAYDTFRIPALLPIPACALDQGRLDNDFAAQDQLVQDQPPGDQPGQVQPGQDQAGQDQLGRKPPVLLAFCEGRLESAADSGPIDLVLRRSLDGGGSWLPLQVICRAEGKTCGNPAPMLDPASGDVVLLSVQNGARVDETAIAEGTADPQDTRRVFVQRSPDLGRSWTDPVEITSTVKADGWGWYATGPCHGIALQHSKNAGRLVVPANHNRCADTAQDRISSDRVSSDRVSSNGGHCIISDDGGHSWRIGFTDDNAETLINANETTVAELADGRLVFNARNHHGTGAARVQAISEDGGESLTTAYQECPDITAPNVQASLLSPDGRRLLLSTPAHPTSRRELTIYLTDDLVSWRRGAVINPGHSGYSDLGVLGPDRYGVLYEAGESAAHEEIRFRSASLSWLLTPPVIEQPDRIIDLESDQDQLSNHATNRKAQP